MASQTDSQNEPSKSVSLRREHRVGKPLSSSRLGRVSRRPEHRVQSYFPHGSWGAERGRQGQGLSSSSSPRRLHHFPWHKGLQRQMAEGGLAFWAAGAEAWHLGSLDHGNDVSVHCLGVLEPKVSGASFFQRPRRGSAADVCLACPCSSGSASVCMT